MGKSAGNAVTPIGLLDEFGSDSVRYWAGSARLGTDTKFDDKVLKVGKRLVTKIFNAGKYVLQQDPGEGDVSIAAITEELDRAFVLELRTLVTSATEHFDGISKLSRMAAAMPMPTSQRPSDTAPGLALRLDQPKRWAPSRMQATSCRVE